ncbi:MAG: mannose-phosphate guanylyltransferase [Myxococcaceae bacterium]|nr:mannose-phosphate guanylyltransferase [Myxococcaceae bacterium]
MGNERAGAIFAVIMAGGSGTRFWPLSRKARPKQFLPLTGAKTMIAETFDRVQGLAPMANSFVVCGALHAAPAARLLKGLPKANVLVEPEARNTAPAIALACAHVAHRDPKGVMVVMPSDQHVADPRGFRLALRAAIDVAQSGQIVTLGIKPTRPETGYGYIQVGAPLQPPASKVARFVEKPDLETAQRYLASGDYLWNAGIFVFRADVMLAAFAELMPELARPLELLRTTIGTKKYPAALKKFFPKMPATSIDYGVAEKAANIAVVRADCGWSDVGSFSALPELRPLDSHGNVVEGNAFVIDSSRCVVLAGKRPLAVVGMKDVVVIDAGDAVLVLPKDKAQDVRKVVEALKAAKLERYL